MNVSSGGIVTCFNGKCYITDIKSFSGTYILDMFGNNLGKINALMWYSAPYGEEIYFSNQADCNYLYVLDTRTGATRPVIQTPCKNLVLVNDYLYFTDEAEKNIKCYIISRREAYKVCDIDADTFLVNMDTIFYSTRGGMGVYNIKNRTDKTIMPVVAGAMSFMGSILVFSDYKEHCALTVYDINNGAMMKIDAVKTTNFEVMDRYIYAVNEGDNNSLVRIDVFKGEIVRVYGESAKSLHVADNNLYFTDRDNCWCRMSAGGEFFTRLNTN